MTPTILECPECSRVRYQRDVDRDDTCPECGGREWDILTRTLDRDDPFDRP